MAILNLTGQQVDATKIQSRLLLLKGHMDSRKAVWDRLNDAKKKKWVLSDKDPIMALAWNIYKYLHDNFFGEYKDDA